VKAALVELAGNDAAYAAGDFVAECDGRDEILSSERAQYFRERQRGRNSGTAHVDYGFVMRVIELQRLGERAVGEGGSGDTHAIAGSEEPARAGRRELDGGGAGRAAESSLCACERQADYVHDA
jgi:hypothetical protein